jgi:phosphate starvation-inducible PhoH-like protein
MYKTIGYRVTLKCFLLATMSISTKVKPTIKSLSLFYKPLTINQAQYNNLLINDEKQIVIVNGPAGTGKTLMACNQAIQALQESKIQKIILTRPLITVENEEMGFLPGNMILKMDPWTRPIMDIFEKFYSTRTIQEMINNKIIDICPLGFMRGRTFKDCFILADEMQNSSPNQMLMLTTRLGENCKLVIMGDTEQTDSKNTENGFTDIIKKYKDYTFYNANTTNLAIDYYEMDKSDIVRSKVVIDVLDIYKYIKPFDLMKKVKSEHLFEKERLEKEQLKTTPIAKTTTQIYTKPWDSNQDAAMIPKNYK